jgi:uncharacterized protein
MIRRLTLTAPDGMLAIGSGQAIRLLAVSDERDQSFDHQVNRDRLGRVDAIVACGDLEPDYLAFLADAFQAPLMLVRGNHDRGGGWEAGHPHIPTTIDGRIETIGGLNVLGLSWPGPARGRAARTDAGAWRQVLSAYLRVLLSRARPQLILSHVPPAGLGDVPDDPYHTGFDAYRWLCRRLEPLLWLHGHTPTAAVPHWRDRLGPTTLVNVTGAVLIELSPASGAISNRPVGRSSLRQVEDDAA